MNNFQQNNLSISKTIQVNFLSVTYINITEDSNIHTLISRLVVAQKEFKKCIDWELPGNEARSKAIELSSILEALIDADSEVPLDRRQEFCEKVIESSCIVINMYKKALSIEGFSEHIVQELQGYTQRFYDRHFGLHINDSFWFELKCFEWLLKEKFISQSSSCYGLELHREKYNYVFNEEQLEEFFSLNRNVILKSMMNNYDEYSGLRCTSPLSNSSINQAYKLYNQLVSVKM